MLGGDIRDGNRRLTRIGTWASLAAVLGAVLPQASTALAGDAGAGARVFGRCKACHVVDEDVNKIGPSLKGVLGRPAGSYPGYNYSVAMMAAGKGGLVWTEAAIASYVRAPRAFVPGNRMAFGGLRKDADIEDLIAYLQLYP